MMNLRLLLLSLICCSVFKGAADDYTLYGEDLTLESDTKTAVLNVYMTNVETISALQFDITLPVGIDVFYGENSDGEIAYLISKGDRAKSTQSLTYKKLGDRSYRVVISSSTNATFKENDANKVKPVASVTLDLSNISQDGSYKAQLSSIVLSHYDTTTGESTPYYPGDNSCKINIGTILGDVDGSGTVDMRDQALLISYLKNENPQGFISSVADVNGDGSIDVKDVSVLGNMIIGGTNIDSNLLPGKFSVSATKQVQFTKGNLYWDGSTFKLEENQTDYPTSWDANHVSHFYWTNFTDYQSGNASYMPYAQTYSYSSRSTSDKFWCGVENPLTVEGTSGLYALTGGSSGEWYYLINSRTNASSLYKYGVTVTNNGTSYENCLIIAPDDFTGTLKSSYTLDEVNNLGLVCLPAAGYRNGSSLDDGGSYGYYWSAAPYSSNSGYAYRLYFYSSYIDPAGSYSRDYGRSLRLVRGF